MTRFDPFVAIADPNRRHLLMSLLREPKTVTELSESLPISRPAVSQHLKALLDSKLVSFTPVGTKRFYAISPEGFAVLNVWIRQF